MASIAVRISLQSGLWLIRRNSRSDGWHTGGTR